MILTLLLCLLLGAVTNWLVAALLAGWGEDLLPRRTPAGPASRDIRETGPGLHQSRLFSFGREYRGCITTMWPPRTPLDPDAPVVAWEDWPTASVDALLANPRNLGQEGFGWPMLSYWYPLAGPSKIGVHAASGGIDLIRITGRQSHAYRAIPLRPIWRGLIAGSAFYAALWSAPLFGWPVLRRRRRRRNGHCPQCNYDLKGAFEHGCPECGWGRPTSAI